MAVKTVIVGVTGGIAAYKSCELVSRLKKLGYNVRVIMSRNATEFVTPLTFETLSNNRVVTDMFDKDRPFEVEHISFAKEAAAFVIAPATGQLYRQGGGGHCRRYAHHHGDGPTLAPVIVCPAMNVNMYFSPAVQKNLATLKERGLAYRGAKRGYASACGDGGKGRMETEAIMNLWTTFLPLIPITGQDQRLISRGRPASPWTAWRVYLQPLIGQDGHGNCRSLRYGQGRQSRCNTGLYSLGALKAPKW